MIAVMTSNTRSGKLVRAPEAFAEMGISDSAGYEAIRRGTLPIEALRIGGQWKFRRSDLDRLLDGAEVVVGS
jgi:excisionase family DNA binding protein